MTTDSPYISNECRDVIYEDHSKNLRYEGSERTSVAFKSSIWGLLTVSLLDACRFWTTANGALKHVENVGGRE